MTPLLLCLHGWGGSKESFTELRAALKGTDIEILTPDLPGFGSEPEPNKPWSVDDYADWTEEWLQKECTNKRTNEQTNKQSIFLLGHSHGGRIALALAARNLPLTAYRLPLRHLFLAAPAGIRHPRHFKRILGLTLAKTGAFFLAIPGLKSLQPLGKKFLYKLVRVHDYERASPVMRQTMINVSAQDLRSLLPQIHVPTDIFWGEDDGMTPIGDAHIMHDGIAGSVLHTYPGVRHAVHREKAREIAEVIQRSLFE